MVIRAAEPVVVDTGVAANREQFLADVFSLVDPCDVRWVFISHDDVDHTGNVNALMDACPDATLVINCTRRDPTDPRRRVTRLSLDDHRERVSE